MDQPCVLEGGADGADPAVHHVGRSNHVGPRVGVRARLAHQRFDGEVVLDVARRVDQPVLPVGGEGIQGDVGDHAELRKLPLDRPHGPLGQALGIPGFSRVQALAVRRGHGEDGDGGDAQRGERGAFAQQFVDGQALHPGHGGDRLAFPRPFDHEHRIDERVDRELGLAHQPAGEVVPAHAPQAGIRK